MAKLNPPRQPCVGAAETEAGALIWRRSCRHRFMHYNMQLASLSPLQPDAAVSTYCAMQFAFAAAPHFTT